MGTLNQTHIGGLWLGERLSCPRKKKRVRFLRCHMAVAYKCLSLIIYHVFSLETIIFQWVLRVEIPSSMKIVHQNIFHQILKHENISKVPKYFWRICPQYLKGPQYSRRKFDTFPSSLPWTKICHVFGLPKSIAVSDGGSPPGLFPGDQVKHRGRKQVMDAANFLVWFRKREVVKWAIKTGPLVVLNMQGIILPRYVGIIRNPL